MLENRSAYGWSETSGIRTDDELQKWQIAYRSKYGSFGIVGWVALIDNFDEAVILANWLKEKNSWESVWVQHPSKHYSNY